MVDYRQLILSLVIAVLFAIFVQTSIEAIKQTPEWNDFCEPRVKSIANPVDEALEIDEEKMRVCQEAYDVARDNFNFIVFVVSALAGLIAVLIGLYVGVKSPVGGSVASGLLLGGLFSIFFGTLRGWGGIGLQIRPFIILAELLIVIWVSYKKLNTPSQKK